MYVAHDEQAERFNLLLSEGLSSCDGCPNSVAQYKCLFEMAPGSSNPIRSNRGMAVAIIDGNARQNQKHKETRSYGRSGSLSSTGM